MKKSRTKRVSRKIVKLDSLKQINLNAAGLDIGDEEIWAATAEDANAIHRDVVRKSLAEMFGDEVAQGIRIQYGGSVKPNNAADYFSQSDIDGALVGGASLKADAFVAIAEAAA